MLLALLSGTILLYFLCGSQSDFHPENFGQGRETSGREVFREGNCESVIGAEKVLEFFQCIKNEKIDKKYLIIGASQLHSINKMQPGDQLAVEVFNKNPSAKKDFKLYQVSTPNANFNDILVIYLLSLQSNIRFSKVILPFVHDDLREYPMQDQFLKKIDRRFFGLIKPNHKISEIESAITSLNEDKRLADGDTKLNNQSVIEEFIESKLIFFFPALSYRGRLSARISITFEYFFTNLFQSLYKTFSKINSEIRYPNISENTLKWNLDAFDTFIRIASDQKTQIIVYRQPIRPLKKGETFYFDRIQYDELFHRTVDTYKKQVLFFDLDNIVPTDYWGETNLGQPDIFHFTAIGHRLLGQNLKSIFSRNEIQNLK